jgi:hypothetical protein
LKDPNLITPSLMPEFYRQNHNPPEGGWKSYSYPRSMEQLHRDVNEAHDNIKKLVRVSDGLIRTNSQIEGTVDALWLAIYGLIAAIGLTVIGLLVEAILK